jgi:hypothetical protein
VLHGLRVKLDKTEAIWVGSRLGSDKKLLPEKTFSLEYLWKILTFGDSFQSLKRSKNFGQFW